MNFCIDCRWYKQERQISHYGLTLCGAISAVCANPDTVYQPEPDPVYGEAQASPPSPAAARLSTGKCGEAGKFFTPKCPDCVELSGEVNQLKKDIRQLSVDVKLTDRERKRKAKEGGTL